jgi:hypothetical protein
MNESAWTYEERYVRCGKANCRKCRLGVGHGPYWYGYRHEGRRMYQKYFGKHHPQGEDAARRWRAYSRHRGAGPAQSEASAPPQGRWSRPKRMDYDSACRIFGVNGLPRGWKPEGTYRKLMDRWHPDHGGSHEDAVAINLAYAFIKAWLRA